MRRSAKLGLTDTDLYTMHLRQTMAGRKRGNSGAVAIMLESAASNRRALGKEGFMPTPQEDEYRKYNHAVFMRRARIYRTGGQWE